MCFPLLALLSSLPMEKKKKRERTNKQKPHQEARGNFFFKFNQYLAARYSIVLIKTNKKKLQSNNRKKASYEIKI